MNQYKKSIDSTNMQKITGYDMNEAKKSLKRILSEDVSDNKYAYPPRRQTKPTARVRRSRKTVACSDDEPQRNGLTPRALRAQQQTDASLSAAAANATAKAKGDALRKYGCELCGVRYSIKSLLDAHRIAQHESDIQVRYNPKRKVSNTMHINPNECKFCDRKFDLERTLHIHQLLHCKLIAPAQRRKLGYTELLHEKKAPLPSVFRK